MSPALAVKHKSTKSTKDRNCLYDGLLNSWIWFSSTSIIMIHPCDFVKVKWKLCCTVLMHVKITCGLSRWLSCKKICLPSRRCSFDTWIGEIPWRRKWQPTTVFLPGESHGQRRLVGCSPWSHKQLDMTEWLSTQTKMTCTDVFKSL